MKKRGTTKTYREGRILLHSLCTALIHLSPPPHHIVSLGLVGQDRVRSAHHFLPETVDLVHLAVCICVVPCQLIAVPEDRR